jgi:hypothetical protein
VKFHGRLLPGRLTDLGRKLELRIHAPARARGVTIKIWEMDTFPDDAGGNSNEGSADDLLATFTGDIETAPAGGSQRAPDWRAFKVAEATIEPALPEVVRFKLQFAGNDTIYEIPILSEADEAEGDDFEIGFSIELGGAEKFRSKSPALLSPPKDSVRVFEARFGTYDDQFQPVEATTSERPMTMSYAAFGLAEGDPTTMDARLKVLGNGHIDEHGYLVVHPDESDPDAPPVVKQARRGRPLFLYAHVDPDPFALGVSKIPIARCDKIGDGGIVRVAIPDLTNRLGAHLLEFERAREERNGRDRYATGAPVEVVAPKREGAEVQSGLAAISRVIGRLGGSRR